MILVVISCENLKLWVCLYFGGEDGKSCNDEDILGKTFKEFKESSGKDKL